MTQLLFSRELMAECGYFASVMQEINELYIKHGCPDLLDGNCDTATTGNIKINSDWIALENCGVCEDSDDEDDEKFIAELEQLNSEATVAYSAINHDLNNITYYYATDDFMKFADEALEILEYFRETFELDTLTE